MSVLSQVIAERAAYSSRHHRQGHVYQHLVGLLLHALFVAAGWYIWLNHETVWSAIRPWLMRILP